MYSSMLFRYVWAILVLKQFAICGASESSVPSPRYLERCGCAASALDYVNRTSFGGNVRYHQPRYLTRQSLLYCYRDAKVFSFATFRGQRLIRYGDSPDTVLGLKLEGFPHPFFSLPAARSLRISPVFSKTGGCKRVGASFNVDREPITETSSTICDSFEVSEECEPDWKYRELIDHCKIRAVGGKGGNGCLSFRREKHVPLGGPNGGNGGPGGSVYIICNETLNSLYDVKKLHVYKAENGKHGLGRRCNGAKGKDLYISVPLGTRVSGENGETYGIMHRHGDKICIARGGRGGKGNRYFMSKFNTAPKVCENGEEGIIREVLLDYRIPANIGLVGKPNSGKSSILRCLTDAKPRVADYAFSTISPVHGVMDYEMKDESESVDTRKSNLTSISEDVELAGGDDMMSEFQEGDVCTICHEDTRIYKRPIMADIPGIIDGASEGRGLGHSFLKHIENCQVITYVVDVSTEKPMDDYLSVRREIEIYNDSLLSKKEIILLNKVDMITPSMAKELVENFRELCSHDRIYLVSAKTLENIETIRSAFESIHREESAMQTPKEIEDLPNTDIKKLDNFQALNPRQFKVIKINENEYRILSVYIERKVSMMRLDLWENIERLRRMLKINRIQHAMKKLGVKEGDTVHIGKIRFTVGSGR